MIYLTPLAAAKVKLCRRFTAYKTAKRWFIFAMSVSPWAKIPPTLRSCSATA